MEKIVSTKLSPLQLELLKVFSFQPSEKELNEVKILLAKFFAQRLTSKLAEQAEKKGITDADLDQWLNEENQ